MSALIIVISLLICQITSIEVVDRRSDEFFYYLTDPLTLSRDNVALKCNYVNLKSTSLLLSHEDYAVSFAKCDNGKIYLVDGGSDDYNNNKAFDFTVDNFPSTINKIGRLYKTLTKPLDRPVEILVPGKILVVGNMGIDGKDYSAGVWQINLKDDQSVILNDICFNATMTDNNLEEYLTKISANQSLSDVEPHQEDVKPIKLEYKIIMAICLLLFKIIFVAVVLWMLIRYLKARKQESNVPYNNLVTRNQPNAIVVTTPVTPTPAPQQPQ